MAGPITTTEIDDAVRKFLAESRFTLQERPGVVKSSIRNEVLSENEGPSVNIPKFGTVTTFALIEGVDMAQAQQITDTNMVITPAEFGAQVVLTDMMLMESKDEFFAVAGRILGESFGRQQEQTLCDDFDSFAGVGGGGDGVSYTYGHFLAYQASLMGNYPADSTAGRGGEAAPEPLTNVMAPAQLHSLRKSLAGHTAGAVVTGTGGTANTPSSPKTGALAFASELTLDGVTVKSSINFQKDTNDDIKGGFFSKESTILVTLGPGADAERERDASLRAWEVNFVGRWARGEYNDTWGRECEFDAAIPAS